MAPGVETVGLLNRLHRGAPATPGNYFLRKKRSPSRKFRPAISRGQIGGQGAAVELRVRYLACLGYSDRGGRLVEWRGSIVDYGELPLVFKADLPILADGVGCGVDSGGLESFWSLPVVLGECRRTIECFGVVLGCVQVRFDKTPHE